ncbi:MAG: hypothetical protein UZ18_ATM001002511 [Armatimonadetes bacterium OLB18]|nr:MAG: hypothetical protein UZ18_ATM001002511 [Armatimonadetes bacterium OLB18]
MLGGAGQRSGREGKHVRIRIEGPESSVQLPNLLAGRQHEFDGARGLAVTAEDRSNQFGREPKRDSAGRGVKNFDSVGTGGFHTQGSGCPIIQRSKGMHRRKNFVSERTGSGDSSQRCLGAGGGKEGDRDSVQCAYEPHRSPQDPTRLLAELASSLGASALLTRLLIGRMLFQVPKDAALLKLEVEALQRCIDRLVRLDGDVNQDSLIPPTALYFG